MKLVLLSGGSGKRLWPLSNDARSKQFLKVLRAPDGSYESMVQRVWRQLAAAGLADRACIATGGGQVDMIRSQLGVEVPVIAEPERRDTFPAVALAAAYLYSIEGTSLDETVVVLPVDPYVDEEFFVKLTELDGYLRQSGAELALIGAEPVLPSEKYGYIVPEPAAGASVGGGVSAGGDSAAEDARPRPYSRVRRFTEKPKRDAAEALLKEGALWNCGVFGFRLEYLVNRLIASGLPVHYEEMVRQYGRMPKISFDYEVVEKAEHIICTPYSGKWKDLGTWNTLTEELDTPQIGKGVVSEDSTGCHLINELDIPVTVIGIRNAVIAASPDGILVAEKEASPRIKDLLAGIDPRPMYEERRWGWSRVLDYRSLSGGREVMTKRIGIAAGKHLSYQQHFKRREVWTILDGSGELVLDGSYRKVGAGDVVTIPPGAKHSLRAACDLELIEVQSGSELVEEDIVRLTPDWAEIMQEVSVYFEEQAE